MLNTTPSKPLDSIPKTLPAMPPDQPPAPDKKSWSWSTLVLVTILSTVATVLVGNFVVSALL